MRYENIAAGRGARALVVALMCCLALPGVSAAASPHVRARLNPIVHRSSGDSSAKRLVGNLSDARTSGERRRAVLHIANAVGVGVYTRTGEIVQMGLEDHTQELYLYDFEVSILARSFGHGQVSSLTVATGVLTRAGIKPAGARLSPNLLRVALEADAAAARRAPTSPASLIPLLIRELGMRHAHPYDLAGHVAPRRLRLDPIQQMLVEASFILPALHARASRGATARAAGQPVRATANICKTIHDLQEALAKLKAPLDPATYIKDEKAKGATKWVEGKLWKEGKKLLTDKADKAIAKKIPKLTEQLAELRERQATQAAEDKLVKTIIKGVHGSFLSFAIESVALDDLLTTHLGPAGHLAHAGDVITFRVQVRMVFKFSQRAIDCFALAGTPIPKFGGVPKVPVLWDVGRLPDMGSITVAKPFPIGLPGYYGTTDNEGISRLKFRPRDELLPGTGPVIVERGLTNAVPVIALSNASGYNLFLLAGLAAMKWPTIAWEVGRHEPAGWSMYVAGGGGGEGSPHYDLSGYTCSGDPFGSKTAWHWTFVQAPIGHAHTTTGPLNPSGPTSLAGSGTLTVSSSDWHTLKFPDDPPLQGTSVDVPVKDVAWTPPDGSGPWGGGYAVLHPHRRAPFEEGFSDGPLCKKP